ncbi:DNA-binding transcriptional regulator, LysR family [Goodfellowiella coeruleoviolacea]|uniref:DNA-binding transcriptional regulator, LysR family n=2 Tax=Goodfellowiella coeruleoviolacea TaxID=334858 RepID=A0AAE3KD46_9PSEU|nr:DNA-binding transcriptional regulator, LysR family [Goodfellowiella coeruleoviolacea]
MYHLRYFVTVAEELNFSQAARKLHMAASPLSQRIKNLEHELGQQLFRRSTHRVELTEAGAALLPIARDVLERFNAIPWRLREAVGPQRRTVLVGVPAALHPDLRARLQELEERCRDSYDLKRWPGTTGDLVTEVHDGRLGLALVRLPVADPALHVAEVLTEPLGAVLPAGQFAGRASVRLADLADMAYVPGPGDSLPASFDKIDTELREAGVRKRVKMPRTDYAGVAEMVSSGLGFSISMLDPESPIHRYSLGDIVVLPFDDFAPQLVTGLIWRRDRAREGAELHRLIEQASAVFGIESDISPV